MRIKGHFIVLPLLMILSKVSSQGSLYTSGTFAKTVNTTLPVGTIGATADVDLSGAATYTIPTVVPPGTNGVQPSLALSYSSMGGNGILGQGWNLTGLSAITRVNRDILHDGIANPIEVGSNDRFALDGQRLILSSGTYGVAPSSYYTEIGTYASVSVFNSAVTANIAFTYTLPNGVKYEYGNTNNSITSNNSFVPVIWRLNKILYPDGNYIEFVYLTNNNHPRISEINYTGNTATGLAPYNKVTFNYATRSDVNTVYIDDATVSNFYFLDNISITGEALAVFKTYQFVYGWDNINSYLNEVIEKGSDGTQLNSTIFKYGDQPAVFTNVASNLTGINDANYISGDFNSDGYSDLIEANKTGTNNEYCSQFKLYTSNGTGNLLLSQTKNLPGNFTIRNKKSIADVYTFYTY